MTSRLKIRQDHYSTGSCSKLGIHIHYSVRESAIISWLGPGSTGLSSLTAPLAINNCHTGRKISLAHAAGLSGFITSKGKRHVTEFDIGEFFIRGESKEVDGEFQAVIVMRAKPPLKTVTYHQVEKDRWFKTAEQAEIAARGSAQELKLAVDAGALNAS